MTPEAPTLAPTDDRAGERTPPPQSPANDGPSERVPPPSGTLTGEAESLPLAGGRCDSSVCVGPLAVPVDQYIAYNTFIPWKLTGGKNLASSIKHPVEHIAAVISQYIDPKTKAVPSKPASSLHAPASKRQLRQRFQDSLAAFWKSVSEPHKARHLPRDAFAAVHGADDAARLLATEFQKATDFMPSAWEQRVDLHKQTGATIQASKGTKFLWQPLGFMFFERIRLRSVGHTLERSPFFELTLTPGEVTTLRHRSFSRQALTLEETAEQSTERQVEFSSTFSTEFTREFERVIQRTTNWGVQQSMSASVQLELVELRGQTDASYSQTDEARTTTRELSRVIEEVARRVESTQKVAHKTVMTVSSERSAEQESIRVLRNEGPLPVKYYFRKVMQVLQGSHERFGVRACWSVPVQDPSRDLRTLLITKERFPQEWALAEEKWSTETAPPEVATMPANIVWYKGGGVIDGGPFGDSDDEMHTYTVPAGWELASIETIVSGEGWAKVFQNGWHCPDEYTYPYPGQGATGDIYFYVHWGARAIEVGTYDLKITCRPLASIREEVEARIEEWRQQQILAEVYRLLLPRYEEIMATIPQTWPPMILMRRIMTDHLGLTTSFPLVDLIHRLFEWDRMSIVYYPPAYDPVRDPKASQCVPTDFLNASWAKVVVPLRTGSEEEALALLTSLGLLPSDSSSLSQLEYFIAQMRTVFEPLYRPTAPFDPVSNLAAIRAARDVDLTPLGASAWRNPELESPDGFEVLSRYLVTVPTDGVDIEEGSSLCGVVNYYAAHRGAVLNQELNLLSSIDGQVDAGKVDIRVRVPVTDLR